MSTNIPQAVRHLITEYRRFLRTTYRFLDDGLRRQFDEHLDGADLIVKGPFVTLSRDLAPGTALPDLVARGEAETGLLDLKWPFGDKPVYRHQERALALARACRSFVITTGTGSGKTEAFLLGVLDGILARKRSGITGIQAVLLYPMNALANDQLERLRRLTRGTGTDISFGLYTGDSDTASKNLREAPAETERVTRAQIRLNAPDILLTNYKQLEFLLVRHDDREMFTPALRYLVLDELHSYRGALATEIACLIRRLKAHARLQPGQLIAIGTSATVASRPNQQEALADFAGTLFGEELDATCILGEEYLPRREAPRTWVPRPPHVSDEDLLGVDPDRDDSVVALAERLTGRRCPPDGPIAERVGAVLEGNAVVGALEEVLEAPGSLDEAARTIRSRFPDREGLALEAVRREVEGYLIAGSVGTETTPPRLRPKLHVFFHGVYDVGLCVNPECRSLVPHGGSQCPRCGSVAFPAALCRTCGQDFVKARHEGDEGSPLAGTGDFFSNESTLFLTHKLHQLTEVGEEAEGDEEPTEPGPTRESKETRKKEPASLGQQDLCPQCGRLLTVGASCAVCQLRGVTMFAHRGPLNTCPACGDRFTRGDIVTPLRTGTASTTSVIATHHLDLLKKDDRKLLLFADNRQDVAHQAGYTADKHRAFVLRHALAHRVRAAGAAGLYLDDVVHQVFDSFVEQGLIRRNPSRPEREQWLFALRYQITMEFSQYSRQRTSLENLGIVGVEYEGLDDLVTRDELQTLAGEAGLDPAEAVRLIRAVLDQVRKSRAVAVAFFQEYIDPNRQARYRQLEEEPFCVRFPEHYRKPQAFAFDRPDHIRKSSRLIGFCQENPHAGQLTATQKLVARLVGDRQRAETFLRRAVELLLCEDVGLLVHVPHFPIPANERLATLRPLQLDPSRIRLVPPGQGYRCSACQTWRPYPLATCPTPRCTEGQLVAAEVEPENYYVNLYTARPPQRMRVMEHSAQISGDDRAQRESDFKDGKLDVLVCTPTLELGVDIGPLLTVALRGAPPTPASYVQRVGRAGRRLRIGFVSTFCAGGAHDRHAFEEPLWLVKGEFDPPALRLDNPFVVERHLRSFILEKLDMRLPHLLGELLDDPQKPTQWSRERLLPLTSEVATRREELAGALADVFDGDRRAGRTARYDRTEAARLVEEFKDTVFKVLERWWARVQQLGREFEEYSQVGATRDDMKKAAARQRAFRELTLDPERAYLLNYLATHGVLPAYQFPIKTFSLDPGVVDTPTIYRSAAIAIEEFAPGNYVYANGHKLRSIRVLYAGGPGSQAASGGRSSAETSGRLSRLYHCEVCDEVIEDVRNACPRCGGQLSTGVDAVTVDAFEAEEALRIGADEESRQRERFVRRENLLCSTQGDAWLYPFAFAPVEYQKLSKILISNWGRSESKGGEGERFWLCPECGRHRASDPNKPTQARSARRWAESHARICRGVPQALVLSYKFQTDCLVLSLPSFADSTKVGVNQNSPTLVTLAEALLLGASDLLELESNEIRSFARPAVGTVPFDQIVFYETVPGGAGYVAELARRLPKVAAAAARRLYGHECSRACYLCLKHYYNQRWHGFLDKERVRDLLFQLGVQEAVEPKAGPVGAASDVLGKMLGERAAEAGRGDGVDPKKRRYRKGFIEEPLAAALGRISDLPAPNREREIKDEATGALITVPDFAWDDAQLAVYCDGFAVHGNVSTLELDAKKRNWLQTHGWTVLTFWGRTILADPDRCAKEVALAYRQKTASQH
ncbi:MAG: DEAD/DEAH box helicase [Holophagae bacterium]|nr:DEAD/DEAH box helicase [Holophagae bacterium]